MSGAKPSTTREASGDSVSAVPRCVDGHGRPHAVPSAGWVVSPSGRRVAPACREHGEAVVAEYRDKLGEDWCFEPHDTGANDGDPSLPILPDGYAVAPTSPWAGWRGDDPHDQRVDDEHGPATWTGAAWGRRAGW